MHKNKSGEHAGTCSPESLRQIENRFTQWLAYDGIPMLLWRRLAPIRAAAGQPANGQSQQGKRRRFGDCSPVEARTAAGE